MYLSVLCYLRDVHGRHPLGRRLELPVGDARALGERHVARVQRKGLVVMGPALLGRELVEGARVLHLRERGEEAVWDSQEVSAYS